MTSYTGTLYDTNVSGQVEILSEPINGKVEVRFLNTGYTTTAYLSNIRAGTIRDKLMPTVYGVGVFGTKYPAKLNGVIQKEYSLWTDMLRRCYDAKEQYLQHLAYRWKGYIDHRAYYALLYYSVEITD